MKLAISEYKGSNARFIGDRYSFLFLETLEDLHNYEAISMQILSRQSVGFWMGFKSQPKTFYRSPMDYACHEVESDNAMAFIMPIYMELSGKSEVSIVDYCNQSDKILDSIHNNMVHHILNGKVIRAQKNGGYCPISDTEYDEYMSVEDINEQEMYNFLLHGDIRSEFKISSETIVIENGKHIPNTIISKFHELTGIAKDQMQVITSFKKKAILFSDKDYVRFFNDGIVNFGLKNIVFETTSQDSRQISNVKKVIEHIMTKHTDKAINVYVMTRYPDAFTTNLPNVNITFIK